MDYYQKDQPKQLAIVEFIVNSKIYIVTKISSFIANYRRELHRSGCQEKRKSREGDRVCKKNQENIRENKSSIKKKLSTKDLVFKER